MNKSRLVWIDLLKGFLLIFVILGHYRENIPFTYIIDFIRFMGPWRVPTYFFISGFLFSITRFGCFKDFLIWKSKTILLPYVSFSIIFLFLDWNLYFDTIPTIKTGLYNTFILGISVPKAGPLWFVFILYTLSIIEYPISKIKNKFIIIVLSISCIAIGCYTYSNNILDYFSINKIIRYLPFFMLGNISKALLNKLTTMKPLYKILIATLLFLLFYYTNITFRWNLTFNTNSITYLSSYIPSFLGIYAITILFSCFKKINNYNKPLIIISRNALIILATHAFILIIQEIIFRDKICLNSFTFFFGRTINLIMMEMIFIFIFNRYFYFLMGKEQKTFKESFNVY